MWNVECKMCKVEFLSVMPFDLREVKLYIYSTNPPPNVFFVLCISVGKSPALKP